MYYHTALGHLPTTPLPTPKIPSGNSLSQRSGSARRGAETGGMTTDFVTVLSVALDRTTNRSESRNAHTLIDWT